MPASFNVVNPANEEILASLPEAGSAGVDKAVKRARQAYEHWRWVPAAEKADKLREIGRRIRERANELSEILTKEGGKPFRENVDEMGWSASCFEFYGELARAQRGRVIPSVEPSQFACVVKEPYGVVAAIVPWNYPILLMAWKLAPALAAGNTVVLKPAEQTPLATLKFKEIFDVLPPGSVEILSGGAATGEALVRHPGVDMVAFTGSLETGKKISHVCADLVRKAHLELGGKDAFVVTEDSDLDVAAKAVAWAAFLNTGQVCTSTERVYVQKDVFKPFLERLEAFAKGLKIGDGLDPQTDVGPMINAAARGKVESHLADALKRGAKIVAGGKTPKHLERGFFFEPTVLTNVKQDMAVMRDETFGPVCPVMEYKNFDEAIRLVNDSIYGLGSILYTNDAKKAKKYFEQVQAGTIWINDPLTDNDAGPFGGYKATGGSRELGDEGLEEFQQAKHIHWDFEQNLKPWWFPYGPSSKSYAYPKTAAKAGGKRKVLV